MGPRKRWALLFAGVVCALYWPLTRIFEPHVRELWFQTVTRALVDDARGSQPPEGKMWLGANRPELPQSLDGILNLQSELQQDFHIASFYQAWGDREEHEFPLDVMRSLHRSGYLPMLTWEPWLSAFVQYGGNNPHASLRKIQSGEVDAYIRRFARDAVRFRRPFLLRPGHEPTNPHYGWAPQYGNSPADFRAFWSHVHRIFREEGAHNVQFVWTPYRREDRDWLPEIETIDWIGFNIFNYGQLSEEGQWKDFRTLVQPFYEEYSSLGPSLIVTEAATSSSGGNKADWVRDMFRSLHAGQFPRIRALVLFDQQNGKSPTGLPVNWSLGEAPETYSVLREQPDLLGAFTRER